jgi:hypothetical protein
MNIGSVDPITGNRALADEMHKLLLIWKYLYTQAGILLPSKVDKPKYAYNLLEHLRIKVLTL